MLPRWALVAYQADLKAVHEVVAVGEVDVAVFDFYPDDHVDHIVAPAF